MAPTTNIILVAIGFCSVAAAIFLSKRRLLFVALLSLGVLLGLSPLALDRYLTRDSYDWHIVVERELPETGEPRVIFIQHVEWISNYELRERKRRRTGSVLLNAERTTKTWKVGGYEPVAIEARVLYGSDEFSIIRNFDGLEAGRYTFTLTFDENDRGRWSVEKRPPARQTPISTVRKTTRICRGHTSRRTHRSPGKSRGICGIRTSSTHTGRTFSTSTEAFPTWSKA